MESELSNLSAESKGSKLSSGHALPTLVDSLPNEDKACIAADQLRMDGSTAEVESSLPVEQQNFPISMDGTCEVDLFPAKAESKLPSRREIDAFERKAHRLTADLKDALSWIYKYIARESGHSSIKIRSSELRNIYVKLESCCSVSIDMEKSFEDHFGSLVLLCIDDQPIPIEQSLFYYVIIC
jgi:hypothetical protein